MLLGYQNYSKAVFVVKWGIANSIDFFFLFFFFLGYVTWYSMCKGKLYTLFTGYLIDMYEILEVTTYGLNFVHIWLLD